MTPEKLLDLQADLLYFCQQPMFQKINAGVVGASASGSKGRSSATTKEDSVASALTRSMPIFVRASYAYRVTADMCSVLEYAASQLDETDTFDRNLAPTGCGFVRFEKALPIHDARGKLMLAHWMLWGPTYSDTGRAGMAICWFNDMLDEPDEIGRELFAKTRGDVPLRNILAAMGRWGFIGVDIMTQDSPLGGELSELSTEESLRILTEGDTPYPHTNTKRYTHALWLLLGQTITHSAEEYVSKTGMKRAKIVGIPGRVTLVTLRRVSVPRKEGETLVEWSHRWIVRSHWRWQRCGPGLQEKRRVWIAPHIKGPEDKPLIVTEKVYNLAR
jgi:hypothetical protein